MYISTENRYIYALFFFFWNSAQQQRAGKKAERRKKKANCYHRRGWAEHKKVNSFSLRRGKWTHGPFFFLVFVFGDNIRRGKWTNGHFFFFRLRFRWSHRQCSTLRCRASNALLSAASLPHGSFLLLLKEAEHSVWFVSFFFFVSRSPVFFLSFLFSPLLISLFHR